MIDLLFRFESTRVRQREAPMLREREQYLAYMFEQGVSKARLRSLASMLLNVVRFLDLEELRLVGLAELHQGSQRWLAEPGYRAARKPVEVSINNFLLTAKNWLRFHERLSLETTPQDPITAILDEFAHFNSVVRGFAPETVRTYGARVLQFLKWSRSRQASLCSVSLQDIDDFLAAKRDSGYRPRSIGSFCGALKSFFRYAKVRGWNHSHLARDIRGPRIPRYGAAPKGPQWKDVRRLLDNPATTPVELRAVAMLGLCSIYGLRSSEVVNLALKDFDWINETFVVARAKRGRVQQFPIQFEVGEAILRYLHKGRPLCLCRRLFVTLRPPYRPVRPTTLWGIVADRMKMLGIVSENRGGHSLRHACATELLRSGSSLREIADFLGHRDMTSVCIYAKYDMQSLQQVAHLSLAGLR